MHHFSKPVLTHTVFTHLLRAAGALLVLVAATSCLRVEAADGADRTDLPVVDWQGPESFEMPPDAVLKEKLTDLQYHVTQNEGTERPFSNEYWDTKTPGIYVDIVSGEPLFSSTDKFKSGTGWPSFTKPMEGVEIVEKTDYKIGYARTEVRSKYADSHLGHVFPDGPEPTGLRYCLNSAALQLIPVDEMEARGYGEYLHLFESN